LQTGRLRERRAPVDAKRHKPMRRWKRVTDVACGPVESVFCALVGERQDHVKRRHHAQEGCIGVSWSKCGGGARPIKGPQTEKRRRRSALVAHRKWTKPKRLGRDPCFKVRFANARQEQPELFCALKRAKSKID
jgi:hypothetical protein